MLVDKLHNEAAKRAAELDADLNIDSQDKAWDYIEHKLRVAAEGGEYVNTSEALRDYAITIARIKNYLDYINEHGSDERGPRTDTRYEV